MRVWIWSDTHTEMQSVRLPDSAPAGMDVLVIAGDLAHADEVEFELEYLAGRYELPIVFVPGNHEFYVDPHRSFLHRGVAIDRDTMQRINAKSRSWAKPVHVLDDSQVVIDGVRFLGATLWTDFAFDRAAEAEGYSPEEITVENMKFARMSMQDYHRIPGLDAARVLEMHRTSRDFLCRQLAHDFAGRTVVVSHHVPHPSAEPPIYRNEPGNGYFTNSAGAFGEILEAGRGPDLWIFGHTHYPIDVEIGRTRLLCNPHGYRGREDGNGFDWGVVADV
ncbi:MAG: metallophosphoesterase [Aliihoeflea sp.]|uniref:metallophosphoesterase n=1 Tax=Aliihoeflea sp. TaxID=2608088 RepID=UPI00403440FE